MYPQSMFLAKNKKNIKRFLLKIFIFLQLKKTHGHVFVIESSVHVVLMLPVISFNNVKLPYFIIFETKGQPKLSQNITFLRLTTSWSRFYINSRTVH